MPSHLPTNKCLMTKKRTRFLSNNNLTWNSWTLFSSRCSMAYLVALNNFDIALKWFDTNCNGFGNEVRSLIAENEMNQWRFYSRFCLNWPLLIDDESVMWCNQRSRPKRSADDARLRRFSSFNGIVLTMADREVKTDEARCWIWVIEFDFESCREERFELCSICDVNGGGGGGRRWTLVAVDGTGTCCSLVVDDLIGVRSGIIGIRGGIDGFIFDRAVLGVFG